MIKHAPEHYKTGKAYGERPPLVIAAHVYPELEGYLTRWRAALKPQHDFVFSQLNGLPLSEQGLYKVGHLGV